MKNSIPRLILEKLLEAGELPFEIFFPPNYSYMRVSRRLFGLDSHPKVTQPTLSSVLSRLKHQGLVARTGRRRKLFWRMTSKGKKWLTKSKQMEPQIPPRDGIIRLVIFDIPEHERKKRDMIRQELMNYNFKMLQKSIWIGFNPFPEDFVRLLDSFRLKNKVHILSIKDGGTIEGL